MVTQSEIVPFADDSSGAPAVRGFLHRPTNPSGDALVLTHGAGSNCQAPLLVAVASAFAQERFMVLRCDLPFRQARPHGPPKGTSRGDQEGLRRALGALRKIAPRRIFLGGHSYGGRQASLLAASEHKLAHGLLLLSYPLHPPRRPDQLRTGHFPELRTGTLFVHGSRDPFGSPEELEAALTLIPARKALLLIEGSGHDLGSSRNTQHNAEALARRVLERFVPFFGLDCH